MADADLLLSLAPRLALERIEVVGPNDRGEYDLTDPVRGTRVRISALEYDVIRALDGRQSVAEVHKSLGDRGQSAVSGQAMLSLVQQLAAANLLEGWSEAPAGGAQAEAEAALRARIDDNERTLIDEESKSAALPADARPTEPADLARAAQGLLMSVSVDAAEVDAMARQAFSRLRAADLRAAANIMRNAAQLAPEQPHLSRWATDLAAAADASPAPAPEQVMQQLVARAPDALAALFRLPSSTLAPMAAGGAASAQTRLRTAPLGAQGAGVIAQAMAKMGDDPTRTSAEQPARVDTAAALLPAWLEGEGTLGLTRADEGLIAQLEHMRRAAQEGPLTVQRRRYLAVGVAVVLGLITLTAMVTLWRRPSVSGVVTAAQPYRLLLGGNATSLSWPHVTHVQAPVDGTVVSLPTLQTNVAPDAPAASVRSANANPSAAVRHVEATVARLQKERTSLGRALAAIEGSVEDGWGDKRQQRRAARLRRRRQERLGVVEGALLTAEQKLAAAKRLGRDGAAPAMAPWPGRVSAILAKVGQRVTQGTPLVQLTDRHLARVAYRAPSIGPWRTGDAVVVTLADAPAVALVGHIVDLQLPLPPPTGAVDKAARARKSGGDVALLVDVTDPTERLARETAANVRVVREDVPLAIYVPLAAVRGGDKGARVWTVDRTGVLAHADAHVLSRDAEGAWLRWPGRADPALNVVCDETVDGLRLGESVRFHARP